MPPLKLKFSKEDLKAKGMRKKYNTLKLVSYCKDQNNYENFILREYLAYKLYNILTDYSFRVQLVNIEYRDVHEKIESVNRYGFLIEDVDELAERLGAKEKDVFKLNRDSLAHFQHDVFALYQYMIGNTDWKIGALHNVKLIRHKETKTKYVIPYDFDYSGFVNASYSIPNVDLKQTHVKERVYMGACKSAKELETVRAHFRDKKEEIFLCLKNFHLLNKRSRKNLDFYLKTFYKTLEHDRKFQKNCLRKGMIWE